MKGKFGIGVLVIAAIAVGIQNYIFFFGGPALPVGFDDEEDDDVFEDERAPSMLDPVRQGEVARWVSQLPDDPRSPFLTRAEAAAQGVEAHAMDFRLGGVLWAPTRRVAWIDGVPRSERDWIGSHQIERIEPEAVWLRDGESLVALEIEAGRPLVQEEDESDED